MITFLTLMFFKHYIIDFVLQTEPMIQGKGIYGNLHGLLHSMQHALGTLFVVFVTMVDPLCLVVLPLFDFIVHYHIDYLKAKYGCKDPSRKEFWNQLGLDQLAHYLTYKTMVMI